MKKQILFLAIFTLAIIFAGTKNVVGQYSNKLLIAPVGCPVPNTINCGTAVTTGPLNPIPGNPYDYEVSVTVTTGGPVSYDWFVIQDPEFIIASGLNTADIETLTSGQSAHIAAIGSGASPYHDPATGTNKINITWKTFTHDSEDPLFLVIYVENTVTCQTDNIQVYEIKPQPSFTLDLVNIKDDGTSQADNFATCVSPIVSATYNADTVDMNYGENYLYYAVSAANFSDSWLPTFQVTQSNTVGTSTMEVHWAYSDEAHGTTPVWNATTAAGAIYTASGPVMAQAPVNNFVGSAGECIIVRVHLTWNNENSEADNTIAFAVDGIMKNPTTGDYTTATLGDLHYSSTVPVANALCGLVDGYTNDKTNQLIQARPTIVDQTDPDPTNNFLPKNK